MASRNISVSITATTSGFTAAVDRMAASARASAASIKSAFAGATGGATPGAAGRNAISASQNLRKAQEAQAIAAGRVAAAQARVNEVTAKGQATALARVSAEAALTKAQKAHSDLIKNRPNELRKVAQAERSAQAAAQIAATRLQEINAKSAVAASAAQRGDATRLRAVNALTTAEQSHATVLKDANNEIRKAQVARDAAVRNANIAATHAAEIAKRSNVADSTRLRAQAKVISTQEALTQATKVNNEVIGKQTALREKSARALGVAQQTLTEVDAKRLASNKAVQVSESARLAAEKAVVDTQNRLVQATRARGEAPGVLAAKQAAAINQVATAQARLKQVTAQSAVGSRQHLAATNALQSAQARYARTTQTVTAAQQKFHAATTAASSGARRFASSISAVSDHHAAISQMGSTLLRFGAVGAIGLGLAAKAAIDWQKEWTGVLKTVDFNDPANRGWGTSTQQVDKLQTALRSMATTMPEAHAAIAQVAADAGALGVQAPAIASFTRTMIQLGDTTGLTSQQAAVSFAQFMNVVGTAPQNIHRLGSSLVALGVDGASTEKQIITMGARIGAAGHQVGLGEQDVLAFSSAIASVGVRVEAGGTSMSRTLIRMDTAVRHGGKGLDALAKTSGVTAKQFATNFRKDPANAIADFVEGLGKMQAQGKDVDKVLADLGVSNIREITTLKGLANATKAAGGQFNILRQAIRTGRKSYAEDVKLNELAALRYTTDAAKIQIAANNIHDAGITIGSAFLPAISAAAGDVAGFAKSFQGLDPAMQKFLVKGAASATVATVIGGSLLSLGGGALQVVSNFKSLGLGATKIGGLLSKAGPYAVAATAGFVAMRTATSFLPQFTVNAQKTGDALSKAFGDRTVKGNLTDLNGLFASKNIYLFGSQVDSIGSAFQRLNNQTWTDKTSKFFADLTGYDNTQIGEITTQFTGMDASISNLVSSGNLQQAAQQFSVVSDQAKLQGTSFETLLGLFPKYTEQISQIAAQAGLTNLAPKDLVALASGKIPKEIAKLAVGNKALKSSLDALTGSVAQQKATYEQYLGTLFTGANETLNMSNAQIGLAQATKAAHDALKKNGKTLDLNTAKGQANQASLNNMAAAADNNAVGLAKAGASQAALNKEGNKARRVYADIAHGMGLTSSAAKAAARDVIKIPKAHDVRITTPGAKLSISDSIKLNAQIKKLPKNVQSHIVTVAETKGVKAANLEIKKVKNRTVVAKILSDLKGSHNVVSALKALKDRRVTAKALGDTKGLKVIDTAIAKLQGKQVKIPTSFANPNGRDPYRESAKAPKAPKGSVNINAKITYTATFPKITPPKLGAVSYKVKAPTFPKVKIPKLPAVSYTIKQPKYPKAPKPVKIPVSATGVGHTQGQIDGIKGKPKKIPVSATGVGAAQGAIDGIHGKSVTVNVTTVQKTVKKAEGGYITGPGGPTSDSIPAWLSTGEYVIRAAAVRSIGISQLHAMNARGYAKGGPVTASGGSINLEPILKLMALLEDLATPVNKAEADVAKKKRAEKGKRGKALKKAQGALKASTDKLTTAQQALADAAKSAAQSLKDPFKSTSKSIDDWLEKMKEGADELSVFGGQVKQLRKLGLSDELVKQITDMGATAGSELASQIIDGGKSLADSLNTANGKLDQAANDLGLDITAHKHADGGAISGAGTGTSDSIRAWLSNGEYVVNARSTAENRALLDTINYGRNPGPQFMPGYATGGYATRPTVVQKELPRGGDVIIKDNYIVDIDAMLRKQRNGLKDSMVLAGLTRAL